MERNLDRRLQPNLRKLLVAVSDYPSVPPLEIRFEGGAYIFVKSIDVVGAQAFAIGRICHEDTLRSVVGPFGDRFALQLDHILHAS